MSKLPTKKELEEILTSNDFRSKESDYISEISSLKHEVNKLRTTIKEKNVLLKAMKVTIKEKNVLLVRVLIVIFILASFPMHQCYYCFLSTFCFLKEKQDEIMQKYADFQEMLQNVKTNTKPSSTKRTPPAKTERRKKRTKEEITHLSDSDDDDDNDSIPLSSLKRTNILSMCTPQHLASKKPSNSDESSRQKPKKAKSPKVSHVRSGNSSVRTTPKSMKVAKINGTTPERERAVALGGNTFLSSEIWKILKEKGWTYRTGPEPHNKGNFIRTI